MKSLWVLLVGLAWAAIGSASEPVSGTFVPTQSCDDYIRPWMPNFFYEQAFGRHEWNKHGTCASMDDDTYFRRAVDAVKTLDGSAAGRYIAANVGGAISKKVFYERVRADIGRADAANAITLLCTDKHLRKTAHGVSGTATSRFQGVAPHG